MRKRSLENPKTAQWHYNSKTKSLHSEMFPRKVMFEGANRNLIVFPFKKMPNQQFEYDEINKSWKNSQTQNAMQLSDGKFVDKANVVTGKFTDEVGQKFAFEYCGSAGDVSTS